MASTSQVAWEAAFNATTYRVYASDGIVDIRIGQSQDGIPAERWAFITAFNPLPQQLSDAQNQVRHQELVDFLTASSLPFYPGEGIGADETWPPETSVLILGISREDALEIAVRFGQVAFVYGEPRKPSELIWTGL